MSDKVSLEQQLIEKLLAERAEIDRHIAFLRRREGMPAIESPSPDQSFSGPSVVDQPNLGVQRGEFYGLSRPQAASALLKKVGKPLTTNQIFEGLRDAAYDVSGKNALNGLYTALSRATDVRKVAPNTWGLREWYPHLKETKKRVPVVTPEGEVRALTLEEINRG